MRLDLCTHLPRLPEDLSTAIADTYAATLDHFVSEEWADAQVDAGRFCEAVLRYLEWAMDGGYTPIDGKSKPNRSRVISAARNDSALAPTLRAHVPLATELAMDFRNNRNSAHLGSIDANKMDAACVFQLVTWTVGEIVRLETRKPVHQVQALIDQLAERHVPLIQHVDDRPIVLDPEMAAGDKAVLLLYQHGQPVDVQKLRVWADYRNSSRWRSKIIKELVRARLVYVDGEANVHLLRTGEGRARRLLLRAA